MLLTRTRVFCADCGDYHQGEVVVREGAVLGMTRCGEVEREYLISSNAELYLKIRRSSTVDTEAPPPRRLKNFLNFIPITNACNFQCAVCASHEPGEEGDRFLAPDEVVRRAEVAQRGGARILHLTGGEPTMHPELLTIVERLAGMGLKLAMVTNGYRLGQDPELARSLKQAGLSRVCLQFDSFDEDTLQKLHRDHLTEKMDAIRNVFDAGLKIGFNALVTRQNLAELPRLLEHHLELGHGMKNMMFASAAPTGRFDLPLEDAVDREEMITSLLEAGDKYGFGVEDLLPLPTYHPWGLEVHPDCGVHIVFVRTPRGICPLNHYVDIRAAYRRFAAAKDGEGFRARVLRPILYTIMSLRRGRRLKALILACRMLMKSRKVSLVNVGIADYRAAMFLDEQRLSRCSSLFHTSIGPVSSCFHYFGGWRHPGSRKNEVLRGEC